MTFRPWGSAQASLGNLQDDMNKLLERIWHAGFATGPLDGQKWAPLIDMHEHADRFTLYVEVPGLEGKDVEVTHLGGTLSIRGDKPEPGQSDDDRRVVRAECRYGSFCRTIELPAGIEADKLTAKCAAGLLTIAIPKVQSNQPKAVKINID